MVRIKHVLTYIPSMIGIAIMLNGVVNLLLGLMAVVHFDLGQSVAGISQVADVLQLKQASGMVAFFLGFLLISLGVGLLNRSYSAWLWTLLLLVLILANSLWQYVSYYSLFSSIVLIGLMLGFRRYFYTKSLTMMPYDRMVAYLTLAFSLIYGVVGSYLLRAQFHGIKSWIDAIYYTIVTYTTLGYGDIYPMTENGKVFTCSMIIVGVCSFLATLTLIVGPLIQKRMQGVVKMVGQFHNLKNHVVFYGYNDLTRKAALKLRDENKLCVFLERHGPTRELIEQDGFSVLKGDGHSNHDLLKVNIEKAREVIFASESDADNILGTMSANECRTKGVNFRIITRVEHEYNIPKARAAGADVVISASQLAGDKIVETVLG